jgi:hypothetical protein
MKAVQISEEKINSLILEKIRYQLAQRVSNGVLNFADARSYADYLTDSVCYKLEAAVWGRETDLPDIKYPATWWDAVKDRFFPTWAKKKWQVTYTSVALKLRETYPKFKPSLPDQEYVVVHYIANGNTVINLNHKIDEKNY